MARRVPRTERPRPRRRRRSRDLARTALDVAGALVAVLDGRGRIVRFNRAAEQATGWRFEEVAGRRMWDFLLPPEEVPAAREGFARLAAGESPQLLEHHWIGRDGTQRLVACSCAALLGPRGEVRLVVSTGMDVTEKRRAVEELRRHAARLEALGTAARAFSSGLDYVATLDAVVTHLALAIGDSCLVRVVSEDGQWLEPVAFRHRDPERDALIRSIQQAAPQRVDEGLTGRAMRSGLPLRIPVLTPELVRAEAKPEYWPYLEGAGSMLVVPLAQRGQVLGHVTMLRDLGGPPYSAEDETFLVEVAVHAAQSIENARLYGLAQAAVAARDEFLSIASHELRTPLTALKLALQNLARLNAGSEPVAPERLRDSCAAAGRQVVRLEKLVSTLLDVSRVQGGRLELSLEEVDLVALVAEVVAHLAEPLAEAGSPVRVDALAPVQGTWDRFRIGQVVTNLLSNAVKYGAGKPITISLTAEGGVARLAVRDQGIGLSAEEQGRLFQRFARAGSARQYGGLGLGLYIARRLAEAHGGRVRVESTPSLGSTFTLELPLHATGKAAPPRSTSPPGAA